VNNPNESNRITCFILCGIESRYNNWQEYRQLEFVADQEEQPTPQAPSEAAFDEPAVEEPLPEQVEEEPHPVAEAAVEPEPTTATFDFLVSSCHCQSSRDLFTANDMG
jgi:hypothetical protein